MEEITKQVVVPRRAGRRGPYLRCFKRSLRIMEFVSGSALSVVNIVYREFTPHHRIKWKVVCAKWNKANPEDIMTLNGLKTEYYRAVRNEDLRQAYWLKMDS